MKKVTLILVIAFMLTALAGCAQSAKDGGSADSVQATENADVNLQDAPATENPYPQLVKSYKFTMRPIYLKAPDYSELERNISDLFIIYDEKVIAVTGDFINDKGSTLMDAHNLLMSDVNIGVENYFKFDPEEYKNLKIEEKQVNGYDTIYYEGQIVSEQVKKGAYMVGYSFIADDTPCNITGIVLDVDQSEDIKKEIQENVDAMMMTVEVRDE